MNLFIQLVISVIIGIILFDFLVKSAIFQFLFISIIIIILFIVWCYFKPYFNSILLLLCFLFCGFLSSFINENEKQSNLHILQNFEESKVTAKAEITEIISIKEKNQTLQISVSKLKNGKLELNSKKSYNLILNCPSEKKYLPGDKVIIKGTLSRIHSLKNLKVKSYEDYLAEKGCFFQIKTTENPQNIIGKKSIKNTVLKIKQKIIIQMIKRHNKENCGLIAGITFGDKNLITAQSEELFIRTGTIHLLAASGMNISIILFPILVLSKKLKFPIWSCALISLPLIVCYIYMANCSASIIRAGLMSFIAIIVMACKREYNLIHSLFLTILIMSLQIPSIIYNIGFQLSSMAVIGIWIAISFIIPKFKIKNKILKYTFDTIVLSLCIESVTAPIIAYHFYQYTPWSALGNLILVPLSTLMLYIGVAESLSAVLFSQMFNFFAFFADIICVLIFNCQKSIGSLPFSFINLCSPNIFMLIIYFSFLSLFIAKAKKYKILITIFPQILLLICSFNFSNNTSFVKLTFFDVGNGDSCLIESDNGKKILIDTGGSLKQGNFNAGSDVIVPYLLKSNISKLDLILLTHSDNDHSGGLEGINKKINVVKILKNTENIIIPQKVKISENLSLNILWREKEAKENNDSSLVVKLNYYNTSMLFCGDISSNIENKLLNIYDLKNMSILKVPHHGSKTSSCEKFVKITAPEIAVISTGYKNKYGHPHKETIDKYKKYGKQILRTDTKGSIQIKIFPNGKKIIQTARTN